MLRDAGAEIVEISLPHTRYALPAYYVIAPAEASSNLARYDGVRYGHRATIGAQEGITEMYERTRAGGSGAGAAADHDRHLCAVGRLLRRLLFACAEGADADPARFRAGLFAAGIDVWILTPATPSAAFGLGEMAASDPVEMYLNDVFTVTVNLAGLPGASVPARARYARPAARAAGDRADHRTRQGMLDVAYALEKASGFAAKPEKWW